MNEPYWWLPTKPHSPGVFRSHLSSVLGYTLHLEHAAGDHSLLTAKMITSWGLTLRKGHQIHFFCNRVWNLLADKQTAILAGFQRSYQFATRDTRAVVDSGLAWSWAQNCCLSIAAWTHRHFQTAKHIEISQKASKNHKDLQAQPQCSNGNH